MMFACLAIHSHCISPHRCPSTSRFQVTYLAWAMETVPRDIYDDCHLYQVGAVSRWRWQARLTGRCLLPCARQGGEGNRCWQHHRHQLVQRCSTPACSVWGRAPCRDSSNWCPHVLPFLLVLFTGTADGD